MPRVSKGARLLLTKKSGRPPCYIIRDTGADGRRIERSTGTSILEDAERELEAYIADKNRRDSGPSRPEEMMVGDVLAVYVDEHAPNAADPERIYYAVQALIPFWADLFVSDVKGATCRRYVKWRDKAAGTVRREMGTLQAALRYCAKEGYLTVSPQVSLPSAPETKFTWLTRDEVAKLVRTAWRDPRSKHIARFILISIYTGTRMTAVLNLMLEGPAMKNGWFDLERGILHRKGFAEGKTNKRRKAVKMPRQLLGHARRWHRNGQIWAIEIKGCRVGSIRTSWKRILRDSDIGKEPNRHTLKHTAITWAMQKGMSIEDAADFFDTSPETIRKTYWHHHPEYQTRAVQIIENKC